MPRWLSKNSKNNFFSPTFFFLISVFISNFASADNSLPVKRVTLSNQATLIHYVDPNLNTAAIDWFVRVGSLQEKSPQGSGVAHLTEHMIFKGAEGGTPGVLMREIESLGGDMNAATSNDYTHYYVEVPKAHYLKALELMSQVILNPAFRQDEFLKERDVVLRELDYRFSLPDYVAYEALFKESFTRHGYRIPPIGFKEKIQQISFNDFKSFYANNYAPENMFISIVGDVDSEKSQQIIKKAFQQRSFDSNYVKVPQPSELPILFQKKDFFTLGF
jgi:predicted Zn-dependent peptidase